MSRLKIAITKGRLLDGSIKLFEKAGLDCSQLKEDSRKLLFELPNYPLDVILAKAPDVITYVEHGVCDLGIVGKDTIMEQGKRFYEVLDLGFGECRFALAACEGKNFYDSFGNRTIASKYPNVTKNYFKSKGMDINVIKIEGSVELAPILGLADAILDVVQTGTTLRENGLEVIEDVAPISARLIVNTAGMKLYKAQIFDFIERCEAAL